MVAYAEMLHAEYFCVAMNLLMWENVFESEHPKYIKPENVYESRKISSHINLA